MDRKVLKKEMGMLMAGIKQHVPAMVCGFALAIPCKWGHELLAHGWASFHPWNSLWQGSFTVDWEALGFLGAFLLFAPMLLAWFGFDASQEGQHREVMNYATSVFFGQLAGLMIFSGLFEPYIWTAYANCLVVLMAFWTSGQQSRQLKREIAEQFGDLSPGIRRLFAMLSFEGQHALAADFIKAIVCYGTCTTSSAHTESYQMICQQLETGAQETGLSVEEVCPQWPEICEKTLNGSTGKIRQVRVALLRRAKHEIEEHFQTTGGHSSIRQLRGGLS